MWRLFKVLFVLIVLGGMAFVAYAFVGPVLWRADFAAPTQLVTETVTLEVE